MFSDRKKDKSEWSEWRKLQIQISRVNLDMMEQCDLPVSSFDKWSFVFDFVGQIISVSLNI